VQVDDAARLGGELRRQDRQRRGWVAREVEPFSGAKQAAADCAQEHRAHSGCARAQEMPARLAMQVLHPQLLQQVFFGIHGFLPFLIWSR
jgi:hypothetical protein